MPWLDNVPAILEGYLGGQAGAGGLADILYGKVNPSGKLAETFPLKLEDNPSYHYFPGGPATVEYRESIYVGYRYYDTVDQEVLFPFGHGLSYTSFEYSDLQLSQAQISDADTLTVTLKVKNTGEVAGQEIVQLYLRDVEASVFRPEKELKGFTKVGLGAGEEKEVSLELGKRAFAYYSPEQQDWQVESGTFEILVGASSQDIRLQANVEVTATQTSIPAVDSDKLATYYNFPKGTPVSQKDFEALLGQPVPPNLAPSKGEYTMTTPLDDMRESFIARQLHGIIKKQLGNMLQGQEDTPIALLMEAMAREIPLRSMLMAGDGRLTREMLEALLTMVNGKAFKGLGQMIKAILNK
jgi:beta-glucosidase